MGGTREGLRRFSLPILLLMVALSVSVFAGASGTVSSGGWRQAAGPRNWAFPRDHGSHPEFRTEWWYFTGNLGNDTGNRFGYQVTFFRQGLLQEARRPENPWSVRDVYLGHFALTDVSTGRFWYAERLSRKGPGLAEAGQGRLGIRLLGWFAEMKDHAIRIEARHRDMELSLELAPRKPIVLHGQGGLSRKGPNEGQASYYYSVTDLATRGSIRTPSSGSRIDVTGSSWYDHEFGSNQLGSNQAGWDWFSLHLRDGRDLMIYLIRRKDGQLEAASSGTLVDPGGRATHLRLSDITIEVLDHWRSPRSGGRYPSRWRIAIPPARIDVVIAPRAAAQELFTEGSTGVVYWEGAVEGKGWSSGAGITCEGYVEMTGYAGHMGGLF